MSLNINEKLGIQPELRTHLQTLGGVGIPFATPVNAVASALTTALAGDNNDLVITAVTRGVAGDAITIRYVNPAANNAALSVTVAGMAITVNLATDGAGAITTIASGITAELAATPAAAALVTAANAGGNNGTGVVTAMAATPLAGGVNGTPGVRGAVCCDANRIYICIANNTISGANWRRIPVAVEAF